MRRLGGCCCRLGCCQKCSGSGGGRRLRAEGGKLAVEVGDLRIAARKEAPRMLGLSEGCLEVVMGPHNALELVLELPSLCLGLLLGQEESALSCRAAHPLRGDIALETCEVVLLLTQGLLQAGDLRSTVCRDRGEPLVLVDDLFELAGERRDEGLQFVNAIIPPAAVIGPRTAGVATGGYGGARGRFRGSPYRGRTTPPER